MNSQSQTSSFKSWMERNAGDLMILLSMLLLGFGLISLASVTVPESAAAGSPLYMSVGKQAFFAWLGIAGAIIATKIPMDWYFKNSMHLVVIGVALLFACFFFPPVNGAQRWIDLGILKFQTSELVKLIMLIYTADFVVRRANEVRHELRGWFRLVSAMGFILIILTLQPDLGSCIVIAVSMLSIYFLAGSPMKHIIGLGMAFLGFVFIAIQFKGFRQGRMEAFFDVWGNEYGTGWQISRVIMAISRGELFGVGLGHSVFKLKPVPELHTDSIIAVIGEEFGFVGISVLLMVYAAWIFAIINVAQQALKQRRMSEGYLVYGIACVLMLQITVNIGMNMQLIPAKGLTLPLISYGGSSLLVTLLMLGFVYRIHRDGLGSQSLVRKYY